MRMMLQLSHKLKAKDLEVYPIFFRRTRFVLRYERVKIQNIGKLYKLSPFKSIIEMRLFLYPL